MSNSYFKFIKDNKPEELINYHAGNLSADFKRYVKK